MVKYYAGIGSRQTPPAVMKLMTETAALLETKGFVLRSGGADGADTAFEKGCSKKEIFLPWGGFNSNSSPLYDIPEWCFDVAARFHPGWSKLNGAVRCLMARNVQQVLGRTYACPPSRFVLCWTPDGVETTTTSKTGGTGQTIRIAIAHSIPVINMKNADWREKLNEISQEASYS